MLDFVQKQSLILTQALLGVISPNFRMISIDYDGVTIVITVILEVEDHDDMEEIEDLKSEFEALQEATIDYKFAVTVTNQELSWPENNTRVVFKRRE